MNPATIIMSPHLHGGTARSNRQEKRCRTTSVAGHSISRCFSSPTAPLSQNVQQRSCLSIFANQAVSTGERVCTIARILRECFCLDAVISACRNSGDVCCPYTLVGYKRQPPVGRSARIIAHRVQWSQRWSSLHKCKIYRAATAATSCGSSAASSSAAWCAAIAAFRRCRAPNAFSFGTRPCTTARIYWLDCTTRVQQQREGRHRMSMTPLGKRPRCDQHRLQSRTQKRGGEKGEASHKAHCPLTTEQKQVSARTFSRRRRTSRCMSRLLMSAGFTPPMRPAWPTSRGRTCHGANVHDLR